VEESLERRSAGLLRAVRDGVLLLRSDLTCLYANPVARRMLGHDDPVGRGLEQLAPTIHDSQLLRELERTALERRQFAGVYFVRGVARWFDVQASPYEGDVLVLFRDVTDSHRRELVLSIGRDLLRIDPGSERADPVGRVCFLVARAVGWDTVAVQGQGGGRVLLGSEETDGVPSASTTVTLPDPAAQGRRDGATLSVEFRCTGPDPGDGAHLLSEVAPLMGAAIERLRRLMEVERFSEPKRDPSDRETVRTFEAGLRAGLERIAADAPFDQVCEVLGSGLVAHRPSESFAILVAPAAGSEPPRTVWTTPGLPERVGPALPALLPALDGTDDEHLVLAGSELPEDVRSGGVASVVVAGARDAAGSLVAAAVALGDAAVEPTDLPADLVRVLEMTAATAGVAVETARTREVQRTVEERFRLVSETATDAIYDWDVAANRISWSRGLSELLGGPLPEAPDFTWWESAIHPDDRAAVVQGLVAAMDHGATEWQDEYRFARADGSYAWVLDRGRFVRDPDGTPVRMVGGMTDRTAHHLHEEVRLRAQRVESIGSLASGIAHDLNNVLTPILMASELLLEEGSEDETVEMIHDAARRGADLVRQILAFGRGMAAEGPGHTDLSRLLDETGRLLRETLPSNIDLRFGELAEEVEVAIDPTHLQQILLNLILNARDALGGQAGRVETTVRTRPVADGRLVVIEVADDGPGIDPRDHERIFERYVSGKAAGEGTGLGLPTAKDLVSRAGGRIGVRSEPGHGATFWVELPVVGAGPDEADDWEARVSYGDGSAVLLVEDEASIRAIVEQALRSNGYEVLLASDGGEAVAALARDGHTIAAVLLDDDLPVQDGTAVVAGLRRLGVHAPVIGMTGHEGEGAVREVADALLPKPFSVEALLSLVNEVVAGRAS
jgi:PAS domain S-box-containing protein